VTATPPTAPPVQRVADEEGRPFTYVHWTHPGARGLVVHFSAFFGKWGDAKPYRDQFQGYFHRLKMLGSCPDHDWLFLCDPYGAFDNGTYYLGERGDLFVERATRRIIDEVVASAGNAPDEIVTVGSSMGGTAALKFGLDLGVRGIVAIGPHIDLDICAQRQNRWSEVAFTVPDGDPANPDNHPITRSIRARLDARDDATPLPRLFLQSCEDDDGLHREQVLPLLDAWRAGGGWVELDSRPVGGHTSDWATRELLLDVVDRVYGGEPAPLDLYRSQPPYLGSLTQPPLQHRERRQLSLKRKRLRPSRKASA
jgi:hypothetical protein